MFEGKLTSVLNKLLGEYVHGISAKDLSVAVFKGDVVLKNLRLKTEALNALDLPFAVRSGLVVAATVALAVPLYLNARKLREMAWAIGIGLFLGSLVAVFSAVLIGRALGLSDVILLSLAPKSVTTPIAMGISEKIGGLPALTAVLVIVTGILGAVLGPGFLQRIGVRERSIQGFAIGLASHGIGTARAFLVDDETGAFSGLAMGLNAVVTALLVPIVIHWLI